MDNNFIIFKYIANSNINKIKELLTKEKNLNYIMGPNSQLPIHDACLQGNKDVIDVLLTFDDKILNRVNKNKNNGYQILVLYPKLLIEYMKKHPPIDINYIDEVGRTILILYLIFNKIDEKILLELKNLGCSLLKPEGTNSLKFLITEKCDKLDMIKKYFDFDVNKLDGLTPISFALVDNNNLECLKKLENYGLDFNLNSYQDNLLSYSIVKNKKEFVEYLLTKEINPDFKDNYENSYFHLVLMNNSLDSKLQEKVFNLIKDINQQNIFGDTILHIIFKMNKWSNFKKLLVKKDVDITIKNKDGKYFYDYIKDESYKKEIKSQFKKNKIKDLKQVKRQKGNDDIKFINNKVPVHTAFEGYYWNVLAAIHYILTTYKKVGFPICKSLTKRNVNVSNIQNECLLCGRIDFMNKNKYIINLNLQDCIKNVIKNDIIFIYIAITYPTSSHANILIIDNKKNTIERFEPYGSINNKKNLELDELLNKKISSILRSVNKKKYKYMKPYDYQNLYDFQHISNEFYKYINETKGFCVAWTFWYLEHKILNRNLDSKKLIQKLKNKVIKNKKLIIDIIRGYAEKLEQYKNKLVIKYGIKGSEIYKLNNSGKLKEKFYSNVLLDLLKLQKIN